MAKLFTGSVNLSTKRGVLALEMGGDYDARTEATDVLADIIAAAREYKLAVSVFAPGAEPSLVKDKASLFNATALEKLAKDRVPVIFQSNKATYPAPYLAMLPPWEPAAKPAKAKAKAGPDLRRKPKEEPKAEPAAPNLSRKRK